jgi:hypothetical protein
MPVSATHSGSTEAAHLAQSRLPRNGPGRRSQRLLSIHDVPRRCEHTARAHRFTHRHSPGPRTDRLRIARSAGCRLRYGRKGIHQIRSEVLSWDQRRFKVTFGVVQRRTERVCRKACTLLSGRQCWIRPASVREPLFSIRVVEVEERACLPPVEEPWSPDWTPENRSWIGLVTGCRTGISVSANWRRSPLPTDRSTR